MNRPTFSVSALTVSILVAVGFFTHYMGQGIPERRPNNLAKSSEDFLVQAGHQPMKWLPYEDDSLSQARRTSRPILLVIGTCWSHMARQIDVQTFEDPEAAKYLSANFVCIRVDGAEHPDWLNAFQPTHRLRYPFPVGFQIWILDPKGHPFARIDPHIGGGIAGTTVMESIVRAEKTFWDAQEQPKPDDALTDMQADDEFIIGHAAITTLPPFEGFISMLSNVSDRSHGGFSVSGTRMINPNAWRYQLITGRGADMSQSLDPVLCSPLYDILDGGIFRLSTTPDYGAVEFSKLTVENAELLKTLALAGEIEQDPFYRELAERTFKYFDFDDLNTEDQTSEASDQASDAPDLPRNRLYAPEGFLPVAQADDSGGDSRSPRYSYPPKRLRAILSPSDRDWARDNLRLRLDGNQQMAPGLANRNVLLKDQEHLDKVLKALRPVYGPDPQYTNHALTAVNGFTFARIMEVARLWGDRRMIEKFGPKIDSLDRCTMGSTVLRQLNSNSKSDTDLPSYLGYSDAMLQDYLTTGRVASFEKGIHTLKTAVSLFGGSLSGEFFLTRLPPNAKSPWQNALTPEIADNTCESATAQMIRLLHDYGRLARDPIAGRDFEDSAFAAVLFGAGLLEVNSPAAAGYYCSAAEVIDNLYAIAVGPHAQELADALYRKSPTRLVAAAYGPVRRDIQARKPGIYLIRGTNIAGPYTLAQAIPLFPRFINPGG